MKHISQHHRGHFLSRIALLMLWGAQIIPMARACGPYEPYYNTYVFHITAGWNQYERDIDIQLAQAWSDYTHSIVTVQESRALAQISLSDIDTMNHPVLNYARNNQDKAMLTYLHHLTTYLNIAAANDNPWEYPTEAELQAYSSNLEGLLKDLDKENASGILADRYLLLKMRTLFRLNSYERCIKLWESTKSNSKNNVFITMAKNLYAGALYHTNRIEEAAVIYASLGDAANTRICMRNQYGTNCMRTVIQNDPNSPMLPYMLEHMMNSLRETTEYLDASQQLMRWKQLATPLLVNNVYDLLKNNINCYYPQWEEVTNTEKIIITDLPKLDEWFSCVSTYYLNQDEIKNLSHIIQSQLHNSTVTDKKMWKSAHAYLLLLQHQPSAAWVAIGEALKMKGSTYSANNARFLQMLISTQHPAIATMEQCMLNNLPWLIKKIHPHTEIDCGSMSADGSFYYYECLAYSPHEEWLRHLVALHLVPRYQREGDLIMELLAWSILCPLHDQYNEGYTYLSQSYSEFGKKFMDMSDSMQMAFFNHIENPDPNNSPFHNYLIKHQPFNSYDYIDVISTHYILQGRWAEAIDMAKNIPPSFLDRQSIAPFATQRSYLIAPWEKRSDINWDITPRCYENPKIDFCKRVIELNKALETARDEEYKQKAFELASLYYHASEAGGCWWLARYSVHNGYEDNLPLSNDAFPYLLQSLKLMHQASSSTDPTLRMQALFSIMANPAAEVWERKYDKNFDLRFVLNPKSNYRYVPILLKQYKDQHPDAPEYLTHCDILTQLCSHYTSRR